VTTKRLALRRGDACSTCHRELAAGTKAWWDGKAQVVTCDECHVDLLTQSETGAPTSDVDSASSARRMDAGEAGRSARVRYEKLHNAREARIDAKFGRLAGVVKFLTDDPQSITAWKKGSAGEVILATSLEQSLGDRAILLHDRRVPKTRGNIDHLVVATSGVWVVDAKNYTGLVHQRDVGGMFKVDSRLYVGRRDCTSRIDGLSWQVEAVRKALEGLEVPVSSAVCFTDAEWKLFAKPFTLKGVFVSGPNALARRIAETSMLNAAQIQEVAVRLSERLPAKA